MRNARTGNWQIANLPQRAKRCTDRCTGRYGSRIPLEIEIPFLPYRSRTNSLYHSRHGDRSPLYPIIKNINMERKLGGQITLFSFSHPILILSLLKGHILHLTIQSTPYNQPNSYLWYKYPLQFSILNDI